MDYQVMKRQYEIYKQERYANEHKLAVIMPNVDIAHMLTWHMVIAIRYIFEAYLCSSNISTFQKSVLTI